MADEERWGCWVAETVREEWKRGGSEGKFWFEAVRSL